MRLPILVLIIFTACVSSPRLPYPTPTPPVRGTLQIVGGGPQPPALVQHFVELAGGVNRANILVFAQASAAGERSGEAKAADFRELGAQARNVWIIREQADADSIVALLANATGIWFGGGDQNRLARVLRGTRVERAIRERYAAGAVVGGTSAGAAVLSAIMITGSERRPGGARRDTTQDWITIDRDNVVTDTGFALIPGAIVDQHFVRRRRHNRLISLVLEREPHLGVGIDESTALVVHPDGRWTVEGASVAVIYDARAGRRTASGTLGATDVRMHVLPAGSTFDPATGRATLP
jgi:cyanophycinase